MPNIGLPEVILVVAVIVLIFGAKRLPEMARSLGRAKGEFKKGLDEGDAEKSKAEPAKAETSEKVETTERADTSDKPD